jgi:pheromone shutdown-related protein TraB
MLVGTAHVSKDSVDEVRQAIADFRPDVVAVELCKGRYDVMKNPTAWQETDIVKVIKDKKASLLFVNLIMASFQRRVGAKLGIKPGEEMRIAIEDAEAAGIPVSLIDRGVQTTLLRTWHKLSFREKFSLMFQSLLSIFGAEDLTEEDIEQLKEKDMLTAALEEVAKKAPVVKEVILDERDSYMAGKLGDIQSKKILAVVGAGHMEGIKAKIGTLIDIAALEEVPPKKKSYAGWIFAVLIVLLIGLGIYKGGIGQGIQMAGIWALSTMFFSAVGALIAFGHPLTILVAAVVSPLTAIHPALASGWFAGLTEAWLKKPKVSDFESIHSDIETIRGFWRNPITRILLVVIMTNLGTAFGSLIAMPWLAKILIKS